MDSSASASFWTFAASSASGGSPSSYAFAGGDRVVEELRAGNTSPVLWFCFLADFETGASRVYGFPIRLTAGATTKTATPEKSAALPSSLGSERTKKRPRTEWCSSPAAPADAAAEDTAARATGAEDEDEPKTCNEGSSAAVGVKASAATPTAPAKAGKVELTIEEELQKERMRKRTAGIAKFGWDAQGHRLLLSNARGIWATEAPKAIQTVMRQLPPPSSCSTVETPGKIDAEEEPRQQGPAHAVAQKGDIHLLLPNPEEANATTKTHPTTEPRRKTPHKGGPRCSTSSGGGKPRGIRCRVTASPPECVSGLAEYVAQEEMSRMEGYWWSPDGQFLAFVEFTEAHISPPRQKELGLQKEGEVQQPKKRRLASSPEARKGGLHGSSKVPSSNSNGQSSKGFLVTEEHRFPFSGQPNVKARIAILQVHCTSRLGGKDKPPMASSNSSSYSKVCSGVRYVDLPVSDWNNDFYVARAQWLRLRTWQQLEALKLLSHEEANLLQKQQQSLQRPVPRQRNKKQEHCQRQQHKQEERPPPVLVLQLQDRLQHERNTWVDLHKDFFQLETSLFYTWTSDRHQYNQLYLQHLTRPDVSFRILPEGNGLRVASLLVPPQNYAPFFEASRRAAAATAAAAEGTAGALVPSEVPSADEDDIYFFLRVIPQIPEEVQSNSTSKHNKSSSLAGDLAPLSSHIVCARLKRQTLKSISEDLARSGLAANEHPKVVDLNCPFIFLSNPEVNGQHAAHFCEGLPLWIHTHHSITNPRQLWVRYMPNIRELFDADAREERLYSGCPDTKREEGTTYEDEKLCYTLEAAAEYTHQVLQRQHNEKPRPMEIPMIIRAGLRNFSYLYPQAAGCGQVLFESQHQQTLFLRVLSSLRTPQFFALQQNKHKILGAYYLPDPTTHGPPPYRGVVACYGGPSVQFVSNSWELRTDPRANALARLGIAYHPNAYTPGYRLKRSTECAYLSSRNFYGLVITLKHRVCRALNPIVLLCLLVIKTDNRGSHSRTSSFEKSICLLLGHREAEDQAAACKHLSNEGLLMLNKSSENSSIEGDRELTKGVGIYGVSYGGFLSCMAHFLHPEIFSAAFIVAPVTFWEGYSTHYSERYLSLPSLNPSGYCLSSVLPFVPTQRQPGGRILLMHGAADENVLLQHSLVLVDALIKQQVPFEFVCLPSSRHGPSSPPDVAHLRTRLLTFFAEALLPKEKRPGPPNVQSVQ
ncbi:dipeptidyl peptidase iv domain-containing protein [Cyclospora cayetanensis]|uniref:Dipeptidyl peptidase iv domain-containing protein n=1 Tax=Cyclospora cayetanensis TaxID=88456 RepID=A0A1D3CSY5_9EIME|nr:dipeptidyl peptidase iv domain-containing protein [Cyclospora cayetanensis]